MKFSDHVILGTHDSATHRGFFNTNFNHVAEAFVCQHISISEQFDLGVRFFDIRIDDQLRVIHGSTIFFLPDSVDPGIFGDLETILSEIETKVFNTNTFAIISLKFDKGDASSMSAKNKEKLEDLIESYKPFNNDDQNNIEGMYLLNRMGGITCSAPKLSYEDNDFTESGDFYIQDCYMYRNFITAEWRDKRDAVIKCDNKSFSGIKMNYTSFIKGAGSIKWDPKDVVKDLFKIFNPLSQLPVNTLPNPLRCAHEIEPWLLERSLSDFKSNIYVVDGLEEDLAKKIASVPGFLS